MMNDELNNLEREIERELARLASRLDVEPRLGVTSAISAAVRHELNESWLDHQPGLIPTAAAVTRARAAVAAELADAAGAHGARANSSLLWLRWATPARGSLAAAAMLLICIGIIRFAPSPAPTMGIDEVDSLVSAFTSRSSNEAIEDAILSLESEFRPEGPATPGDDDALEDLVREIDQIIEDHEPAQKNSAIISSQRGVIG